MGVTLVRNIFAVMPSGEYWNVEYSNIDGGAINYSRLTRKRSNRFRPHFQQNPVMMADKLNCAHFSKFVAFARKFDSEWPIYAVHVAFFGIFRLFSSNFCEKRFPDLVHLGHVPSLQRERWSARQMNLPGTVANKKAKVSKNV
jgi:hypothetical protein